MRTKYQAYMDRQTISPELHQRLLSLEQRQPERHRLVEVPKPAPVRWRRWSALAASLVLVVGLVALRSFSGNSGAMKSADMARTMTAAEETAAGAAQSADMGEGSSMEEEAVVESADMDEAEEMEESMEVEAVTVTDAPPDTAWTEEMERLSPYATDYLGDSVNVVHIAAGMTYPDGWQYDHVELHTDGAPYGLDIWLTGSGSADLQANSDTAFALIGNVEVVRFLDAADGSVIGEYER